MRRFHVVLAGIAVVFFDITAALARIVVEMRVVPVSVLLIVEVALAIALVASV